MAGGRYGPFPRGLFSGYRAGCCSCSQPDQATRSASSCCSRAEIRVTGALVCPVAAREDCRSSPRISTTFRRRVRSTKGSEAFAHRKNLTVFAFAALLNVWNNGPRVLVPHRGVLFALCALQSTRMMEEFLALSRLNTQRNLETCAVLAGSLVSCFVFLPFSTGQDFSLGDQNC